MDVKTAIGILNCFIIPMFEDKGDYLLYCDSNADLSQVKASISACKATIGVLEQIDSATKGRTDLTWTEDDLNKIVNNFIVPNPEKHEPTQHNVPTAEPAENSETENQNFLTLNDFANMLYGQHRNGEFDEPTIEVYDDRKAFREGGEILLTLRSANMPELYLQPKYANAKVEEFQCTGEDTAKCLIVTNPACRDYYIVTEVYENTDEPEDGKRCLKTYTVQVAEDAFVDVLYDCIGGVYYIATDSRDGTQVCDSDGRKRKLPFDLDKVMDAVVRW